MSERLTKKDYEKWHKITCYYNKKDVELLTQIEHKLGKLEDLMEKYGIESAEELDKCLELGFNLSVYKEMKMLEKVTKDRDTWKKACELAVGVLRRNSSFSAIKDDFEYLKNISTYEHNFRYPKVVEYFYQQAQKEKEDERKTK